MQTGYRTDGFLGCQRILIVESILLGGPFSVLISRKHLWWELFVGWRLLEAHGDYESDAGDNVDYGSFISFCCKYRLIIEEDSGTNGRMWGSREKSPERAAELTALERRD
jgi:hypothetical protein